MSAHTSAPDLLARLEHYYDAVPRTAARVEAVGPFTLFIPSGEYALYARPRLGLEAAVTADDVAAVTARQRVLGQPEALEWVVETTPSVSSAARAAGLTVQELPLLVLATPLRAPTPPGVSIRRVEADDADLARIVAVASLAFGDPGTAEGEAGPVARDRLAAGDVRDHATLRHRLASGATVLFVAEDSAGPIASGGHQRVGAVSEIVGVATLPAARRRGLGAAVTDALISDARASGILTVFLSAASDAVARIYERLGFERVAHAGIADRGGPHGVSAGNG